MSRLNFVVVYSPKITLISIKEPQYLTVFTVVEMKLYCVPLELLEIVYGIGKLFLQIRLDYAEDNRSGNQCAYNLVRIGLDFCICQDYLWLDLLCVCEVISSTFITTEVSSDLYLLVFMWDCTVCGDTFVWKVNSSPVGGERERVELNRPVLELSVCGPARPLSLLISTSVYRGGVWNSFSSVSHPEWLWRERAYPNKTASQSCFWAPGCFV